MYVPSYIRMTRAPSFVPVLFYLGRGNQFTGDEVTLSTTSHPNFFGPFFDLCHIYSSSNGRELDHLQKS